MFTRTYDKLIATISDRRNVGYVRAVCVHACSGYDPSFRSQPR